MGDVPPGSELLLHPFPLLGASRAVQISILEFSKDGSADLGDELRDGDSDDQLVILQGGVGHSCYQVS